MRCCKPTPPRPRPCIRNLIAVIAVLAAGGVVVSAGLAALVASSIAGPLRDVQRAMSQVRHGALDVRCAVASNDEIGSVAEGFNQMVEGLRERERIRETFGRYVSPEVRDEILAGVPPPAACSARSRSCSPICATSRRGSRRRRRPKWWRT